MKKYIEMIEKENLTREEFLPLWNEFKQDLNKGNIRVAYNENGEWKVNTWVKKFILLGFKFGKVIQFEDGTIVYHKDYMNFKKGYVSHPKYFKCEHVATFKDKKYFLCGCKKCKGKHVLCIDEMKDFECTRGNHTK